MESFRWGPQFVTGITEIDDQHQSLVAMINNYGKALAENTINETFLLSTFKELTEYTRAHFDTEERLMAKMQLDPRHTKPHLQLHSDFVTDISNLIETIHIDNPNDHRTLFEYLVHWLAYHTLVSDKNMSRQISAIKSGTNPADAFNNEERKVSSSTEPLLIALNGLFALVSQRNKTLVELNQTLEKRVAERTKDLSKANEALELISITDHLTQLPNRRFAITQLDLLWEEATTANIPLACLMVDADGFKFINDNYGHDAGDVVLQQLAKELQHSVRSDDIVCRLGGDEFVIICPNTDLEGALHLGEQTRAKVAAMKVTTGDGFWVGSVSIGVASTNEGIKNVNTLLKAADDAVYLAKKDGKNCVRSL